MNFSGILLGLVAFLCIGLFHPLVIKGEYYFGTKCWWVFALVGIGMLIGSLFVNNMYLSVILGIIAFSSFWSIGLSIILESKGMCCVSLGDVC